MINKQNKHGPRSDLMQGDDTNRGFFPSYPACYPIKFIIKPPGNRRTTLNLWSQIDIACGLPALSHSGRPVNLPPYTTQQPWDSAFCLPGETPIICCKGTVMQSTEGVIKNKPRELERKVLINNEPKTENQKPITIGSNGWKLTADC